MMDATFYHSVFSSLLCAICVVDCQGRILRLNPALERLLGWQQAERRGKLLAQCLERGIADPALRLCWTMALSQALVHDETTNLGLATPFLTEADDGHTVSVTGIVAPWRGDDAEPCGALVILHDSALHQDVEGVRSRFLAVVAHELGSPVTNIAAAADLLAARLEAGHAGQEKLLEILRAEVTRLQRLLRRFLSMPSRPARCTVTLLPLVRSVAQTFQLRGSGHQIIVRVPPSLPFVWGDADGIQEVLSNLVDNAIRYSPAGAQIILAAEARKNDVLVRVADQGHGIAKEDESVLFEPGWRSCRDESGEGHGLGLPVARALIQALGGELWYEREGEGGSCFCFTLPLAYDRQSLAEERAFEIA